MHRAFFVFLKCTMQGGPKVDVLLIAFLYLWLKFWEGIDKYWIVPVRKLFYFHHRANSKFFPNIFRVSLHFSEIEALIPTDDMIYSVILL